MNGDVIRLRIPARPDYILAVRLAVSAVAQRVGFDIDNIEDLKVASAEACTLLLAGCPQQIDISLTLEDGLVLLFEACDFSAGAADAGKSDGMSQYLLDALVDKCEMKDDDGVIYSVRLTKTL